MKIKWKQLLNIIDMLAYPLIATLVYMFAYTPSIKDVVTNTESNFETSGGFGPNQVSTILGLGIFLFFVKIILNSKNKKREYYLKEHKEFYLMLITEHIPL